MLASVAAVVFSGIKVMKRIDMKTLRSKTAATHKSNNWFKINIILVA